MKDVMNETAKLIYEEQKLEEMANIQKSDYNTPVGMWIDELGNKRKVKHNEPRMKIVNNYEENFNDVIPISISTNPEILDGECKLKNKDLKLMKQFIAKNYDIFMQRWNNEISTREMFNLLDANN